MADSAAMRSRSRAARSNSIASAAAIISSASRSRTARLLPDEEVARLVDELARSPSGVTSPVQGPEQRLIW